MKDINFKFPGIKRIVISRFNEDVVFVFTTKNNIYVKKISFGFFINHRKALVAAAVTAMVSVSAYAFYISDNFVFDYSINETAVLSSEDEKIKQDLLASPVTDYSDPDGNSTLKFETYVVKKGDTLGEIAKLYGVSPDTICGSSGLTSYDLIQEGTKLKIPNKEGIIYKIRKGETLDSIVKKFKANKDKIIADNPALITAISLDPGKDIFIPDVKPQNIMPGFMWPTYARRITSGYGWRRNPIAGGTHFHTGLDIGANYQPVRASRYGKVTYAGWLGGYGKAVVISHPGGYKTLYGHLSAFMVRPGQYVKQGQNIARSGNTGSSTGPHLHFEVIRWGSQINPFKLLKR